MGFRSPGHGLLAGYQSAMAHNMERDKLGAAQANAQARQNQKSAQYDAKYRKDLTDAIETMTTYLRTETPDSRPMTVGYAKQMGDLYGADWPEYLRAEKLVPQTPIESPGKAGAPPGPQAPAQGASKLYSSMFGGGGSPQAAGGGGGSILSQILTGGRPSPQASPQMAQSPAAPLPTGLTDRGMRGFGSAKIEAESLKAGQDIATQTYGPGMRSDLLTYIATGGGQHAPQPGLLEKAYQDLPSLSALLFGHAANYEALGVAPEVVAQQVKEIWDQAYKMNQNKDSDLGRQYEAVRIQLSKDDLMRGYLSDIERQAQTLFGGQITNGMLNISTIAEGDKPRAIFFINRALSRIQTEGMNSVEAILNTTEEMSRTSYFPRDLGAKNADGSEPLLKPAIVPGMTAPGSSLEPAEAASFPWDEMFPGSQHEFLPSAGLYLITLPDGSTVGITPEDIAGYASTTVNSLPIGVGARGVPDAAKNHWRSRAVNEGAMKLRRIIER